MCSSTHGLTSASLASTHISQPFHAHWWPICNVTNICLNTTEVNIHYFRLCENIRDAISPKDYPSYATMWHFSFATHCLSSHTGSYHYSNAHCQFVAIWKFFLHMNLLRKKTKKKQMKSLQLVRSSLSFYRWRIAWFISFLQCYFYNSIKCIHRYFI